MSGYEPENSEASDLEEKPAPPKKKTKLPTKKIESEDKPEKKLTTKAMIIDALMELKSRKGVSLYAIKKHLSDKFNVDTEKLNFVIKKTLKTCVEDGTFVQTKGIGASGSFKVVPNKITKPKKSKIPKKIEKETKKSDEKMKTMELGKTTTKPKKAPEKKKDTETKAKAKKILKKQKAIEESDGSDMTAVKKSKVKMADVKSTQTPAKKRAAMMKRKSIGSIIKPPKMKPKKLKLIEK